MRAPGFPLIAAFVLLAPSPGCDDIADFIDEATAPAEPEAPSPRAAVEEERENGDALPERPADSVARSETGVITFQSILENPQMTQAQRIRAFENLDPAALQKRVARPNVTGAPTASGQARPTRTASSDTPQKANAVRSNVPVVMYSTDWCGVCKRARRYFDEQGIAYTEYDVDRNLQARNEYLLLNPRRSVPTIKIGSEVIIGFSPAAVQAALSATAR